MFYVAVTRELSAFCKMKLCTYTSNSNLFYVPNTAEINHPVLKLLRNFRDLQPTVDLRCLLTRMIPCSMFVI